MTPPVGYIAYVDEAGDDGLQLVRTRDNPGASEWMVLSAILVRADRESTIPTWLRDIIIGLEQHQLRHLHFHKLPDDKKLWLCQQVASLPLRVFTVISHKKNMERHVNLNASRARVNRTAWFYAWMTRILLERITAYCARRSAKDFRENRYLKVEISQRGGVNIQEIRDYLDLLRKQGGHGMVYLNSGNLAWEVVDLSLIQTFPNRMRAGLQLADIAASAFYAGLERTPNGTVKPDFAKALRPVVCMDRRHKRFEFGFKVMPGWIGSRLPDDQADLIKHYSDK